MTRFRRPRRPPRLVLARAWVLTISALAALALPGSSQVRQGITGYIVEEGTRRPVQGAFVVLLDPEGRRLGGTLSHDDGRFIVAVPGPGRYRLQPERIGFRAVASAEVVVPPGELVRIDLVAPAQAVQIRGIEVGGAKRCDLGDAAGRATMGLWEEARKALRVARWTESAERFEYDLRSWDRTYDPRGERMMGEHVARSTHVGRHAFRAVPPEALVEVGYVVGNLVDGYDYYAPDAEILLSDSFLRTHCFQAVRRDARLGLRFEPVPGRTLPDVRGTLWMAPNSTRLERLEYRYVNVPELDESGGSDRFGGEVRFEELPGGEWIVRWWEIRMPVLMQRLDSAPRSRLSDLVVAEVKVQGGEVEEVRRAAVADPGIGGDAVEVALVGMVTDSTAERPLPGARVFVVGTEHETATGPDGSFRMAGLVGGVHTLALDHPRLAQLGIASPKILVDARTEGEVEANLAIPSLTTLVEQACAAVGAPVREPGQAAVAGVVRTEGVPADQVQVQLRWEAPAGSRGDAGGRGTATIGLDAAGRWGYCSVPRGHRVEVRVSVRSGPDGEPLALGVLGRDEMRWVVTAAPTGASVPDPPPPGG